VAFSSPANNRQTAEPIKPAPPVTKTFIAAARVRDTGPSYAEPRRLGNAPPEDPLLAGADEFEICCFCG